MTEETAASGLTTAAISDALDRLAIAGQCRGLRPLAASFRLAGPAFTVRMVPVGTSQGTVGDYVDDVPPGHVVVIDGGGCEEATVWGDILTLVAHRRKLAGTVIDGVCRDVAAAVELGYPLFSRGAFMRTGKGRLSAEAINVPVTLGGCRVEPGDQLFGDADGVVVVPRARLQETLVAAREIEEAEQKIRQAVMKGMSLAEARRQYGYHELQRQRSRRG